jgi:hypothetical protein
MLHARDADPLPLSQLLLASDTHPFISIFTAPPLATVKSLDQLTAHWLTTRYRSRCQACRPKYRTRPSHAL